MKHGEKAIKNWNSRIVRYFVGFVFVVFSVLIFTACESDADRLFQQLDELEEAEEYDKALDLIEEEVRSGSFDSTELQQIERREEQFRSKASQQLREEVTQEVESINVDNF